MPFVLLTSLNLLSLALCVSKLPHTRLLAALFFCLKIKNADFVLLTSFSLFTFHISASPVHIFHAQQQAGHRHAVRRYTALPSSASATAS